MCMGEGRLLLISMVQLVVLIVLVISGCQFECCGKFDLQEFGLVFDVCVVFIGCWVIVVVGDEQGVGVEYQYVFDGEVGEGKDVVLGVWCQVMWIGECYQVGYQGFMQGVVGIFGCEVNQIQLFEFGCFFLIVVVFDYQYL